MTKKPFFLTARMDSKLAVVFVLIGLLPLVIAGALALVYANRILREQVMGKLQVVADGKAGRMERFLRTRVVDVTVHAQSPSAVSYLESLSAAFHQNGIHSPEYAAAAMKAQGHFTRYAHPANYDNVLLVDADGNVVFSVFPTDQLGANLRTAPYQDTALAIVLDKVGMLLAGEISDYEPDAASGEQKAFVAAPIFKNGVLLGALVLRINNRELFGVAGDYSGLGDTGETIFGRREGDTILVMAPTRHDPDAAFHRRMPMGSREGGSLQEATRGNNGIGQARDYRGVDVLAAWEYLPSLRCGLVVKQDTAEAFAPVRKLSRAAIALGVLMALLVAFLAPLAARYLAAPIRELAETQRAFSAGDLTRRARVHSDDEIGKLAAAFNQMADTIQQQIAALSHARNELELRVVGRTADLAKTNLRLQTEVAEHKRSQAELENIHRQLMEASRRAGMAEIAANVLHNVGNVLNSVNISTGLIVENVKKSRASSLARVVALLREHAHDIGEFITNDPGGKHVPAHLAQLSEQLLADQAAVIGELDSLRRNIDHIKEIVAMQQSYATFGGVTEMVNVADLVEDSLRMNEGALNSRQLEVIREFEPVPPVNVEKHKILQILVNLMRNAKHACDESGRADKRLTVRVANGDGRIRISVIDNGVGIPPENLTRIFNHGFTTRKNGHGFGLHSAALAAREMGGALAVHSAGPGTGATFTLELPLPDTGGDT